MSQTPDYGNFSRIQQAAIAYEQRSIDDRTFKLWLIQEISGLETYELQVLSTVLLSEITTTDDLMLTE